MGRLVLHWVCVCALVVPLIGCSDETTAAGGTGGSGDTGGDGGTGGTAGSGGMGGAAGMGGTGGDPVGELSVTVTEVLGFSWEDTIEGPPLEGVELCETGTSNCATTDAEGEAILMLPLFQEVSYTVEKEGWVPWLIAGFLTAGRATQIVMLGDQLAEEISVIMGTPYPWEGGVIALTPFPRMAGVTFDLVDAVAEGFYEDEAGIPNPDLTATTSDGRGGFVEVSPGEYEVEFGGTATTCTLNFGWAGDAANRIRLPVQVGYLSFGSMIDCDAP
jgi:hypothetical protein